MLQGSLDPVSLPEMSEGKDAYFLGPYERRLVAGTGHFLQRERSGETAREMIAWLDRYR